MDWFAIPAGARSRSLPIDRVPELPTKNAPVKQAALFRQTGPDNA